MVNVTSNKTDGSFVEANVTHWGLGCDRCHPLCYQCIGPTVVECTACTAHYYLKNNTCLYHVEEDILDFFIHHRNSTILSIIGGCAVLLLIIFLVIFSVMQYQSHGKCPCCQKRLSDDYKTRYRRPEEARINLGGKNVNLRNGNAEFLSQEQGLLEKFDDDFDDNDIFDDHIDFEPIKVTGPRYLERGRRLEIICNATGQVKIPKSIKWFKDGRRFHSNPPKGVMVVKRRENRSLITLLSIEKTKIRDCGEYVCLWRKHKADSLNVHIVKREYPQTIRL
ncbi:hypothetical protein LSH36_107g13004 [Paralvinella palmiformis]|uniref:Ig-like domain-containing protein n=1 Tax=Paralvinella palmiformis TaxID=53620 RepID=A0AAD9NB03_9ANNE|nr:hypothetical protein LSH36_107g13004 [Paralvinella palmiformis]